MDALVGLVSGLGKPAGSDFYAILLAMPAFHGYISNMRPEILFPLFGPVEGLPGVGPKVAEKFARLGVLRILDLLFLVPHSHIDRRARPSIQNAKDGQVATFEITVDRYDPPASRKQPYRVQTSNETGFLTLSWFHSNLQWVQRQLPIGSTRVVSGRVERFHDQLTMLHPDHILKPSEADTLPPVEPVYPLTQGLSPKTLRKAVLAALERAPELKEWISQSLMLERQWPDWHEAVNRLHHPDRPLMLGERDAGRMRLAYDELLSKQLALALVRHKRIKLGGHALHGDNTLVERMIAAAPFAPTNDQRTAYGEIAEDLEAPVQMSRLLQGDVGAGKTFVAAMAATHAHSAGVQTAMMAPTEILARQHARSLREFLEPVGIVVETLTGKDKGKKREAILQRLAEGEIHLLCGTHALFQKDVAFAKLGLVIVDEQHRFGVSDRVNLVAKGARPDLLVMTATPIPRTLALSQYGDMDISMIREKPAGRKPVKTVAMPLARMPDIIQRLRSLIAQGGAAYWVCPLVEESDKSDLSAAEDRFAELRAEFGDKVGLVHGRMRAEEKSRITDAFRAGEIRLLVATTVIEVGVDAPNATVMVIEHAERFGLSQLHQLRGRVGRSDQKSSCLLLYQSPLGETAKQRIEVLRQTNDGFIIAEKDAALRGTGDLLGTRQSGQVRSRFADEQADGELLDLAHTQARMEVQKDPDLGGDRGEVLRTLLYLFEQDRALLLLGAG